MIVGSPLIYPKSYSLPFINLPEITFLGIMPLEKTLPFPERKELPFEHLEVCETTK